MQTQSVAVNCCKSFVCVLSCLENLLQTKKRTVCFQLISSKGFLLLPLFLDSMYIHLPLYSTCCISEMNSTFPCKNTWDHRTEKTPCDDFSFQSRSLCLNSLMHFPVFQNCLAVLAPLDLFEVDFDVFLARVFFFLVQIKILEISQEARLY